MNGVISTEDLDPPLITNEQISTGVARYLRSALLDDREAKEFRDRHALLSTATVLLVKSNPRVYRDLINQDLDACIDHLDRMIVIMERAKMRLAER